MAGTTGDDEVLVGTTGDEVDLVGGVDGEVDSVSVVDGGAKENAGAVEMFTDFDDCLGVLKALSSLSSSSGFFSDCNTLKSNFMSILNANADAGVDAAGVEVVGVNENADDELELAAEELLVFNALLLLLTSDADDEGLADVFTGDDESVDDTNADANEEGEEGEGEAPPLKFLIESGPPPPGAFFLLPPPRSGLSFSLGLVIGTETGGGSAASLIGAEAGLPDLLTVTILLLDISAFVAIGEYSSSSSSLSRGSLS